MANGRLLWLTIDRRKSVQVNAVRQCRQPGEDAEQLGVGVFPVALAGYDGRVDDRSWETEVWVAEAPSHMIHFN